MKHLPPRDLGVADAHQGLYRKWRVKRLNDPRGKHLRCQVFVLDLRHDPFAAAALEAYAAACALTHPQLAADVRERAAEISRRVARERPRSGPGSRDPHDGFSP